jgi:hypothetical protein
MKKFLSSLFLFAISYLLFAISPSPALAKPNQNPNAVPSSRSWTTPSLLEDAKEIQNCNSTLCLTGRTFDWWNWSNTTKNILLSLDFPVFDNNGQVYRNDGAFSVVANLTNALYLNPPATTTEYIAYVGQNLGLIKPAYAQSVGQKAIGPILEIWKIFRDTTYIIFVLTFIIIGFMIMFRRKLDPQTVIGIQQAIPRLVISLLLITFSYAIVGFMVDLMQLSINLTITLLRIPFTNLGPGDINKLYNENVFNLIKPITNSWQLGTTIGQIIKFPELGKVFEGIPAGIGTLTVWAVFGLAGFFIMFKIFFMLLSAYVAIVLNAILAPIRLLTTALPGSHGASDWIKDLLSNILVFPITFILILLAAVFESTAPTATGQAPDFGDWQINQGIISGLDWAPPLIGTKWGAAIGPLIAYGILFAIPAINKQIQQMLEIKPGVGGEAAMQEIKENIGRTPLVGSILSRVT